MHRKPQPVTLFLAGILGTALLIMACSTSTSPAMPQSAIPQASEETQVAENLPSAGAPESPAERGATRQNPIPIGQLVSTPGWDVQVQAFYRGDQALEILRQDSPNTTPAPEGSQYAVASVYIRCTSIDDASHSIGLSEMYMTGDQLGAHTDQFDEMPAPEFLYKDLFTAETFVGWVDAIIPTSERNLILVFDPADGNEATGPYYFALEDGASISIPAEFREIQPDPRGQDPANPLPMGETAITEDWQTGIYLPEPWTRPWVYTHLFPGAQYEGWAVLKAPENGSGINLVFDPDVDAPGGRPENIRYLALE